MTNKIILSILLISCMICSDFIFSNDVFLWGKFRFLMIAVSLIASAAIWRANPFIALFAGLSAMIWILNNFAVYGAADVLAIYGCAFMAMMAIKYIGVELTAKIIAYCSLFQAVYGILQACGVELYYTIVKNPEGFTLTDSAIGTFGHPTLLAPFLSLGMLYFIGKKEWPLSIICGVGIALCHSTAGLLSAGAGLFYVGLRSSYFKECLMIGVASFISLVIWKLMVPSGGPLDLDGRQFIWPHGLRVWSQAPYFGFGPGSWMGRYTEWQIPGKTWSRMHSDWLQVAAEQGGIGFLIVCLGVATGFVKSCKKQAWMGAWIVMLAVDSAANFIMHIASYGIVAAFALMAAGKKDEISV